MSTRACWNCGYNMNPGEKTCRRCEANQEEHPEIDPNALAEAMKVAEASAPGLLGELRHLAMAHDTAEGFVNALMVGECPKCGGQNVGDCELDPDYGSAFLGRCFTCGAVWCTECRRTLGKGEKHCPDRDEHFTEFEDLE